MKRVLKAKSSRTYSTRRMIGWAFTVSPLPATALVRRKSSEERRDAGTGSASKASSAVAGRCKIEVKQRVLEKWIKQKNVLNRYLPCGSDSRARFSMDRRPFAILTDDAFQWLKTYLRRENYAIISVSHTALHNVKLKAEQSFDEGRLAVRLHSHNHKFRGIEFDVETSKAKK